MKGKIRSVRAKLFLVLSVSVLMIIAFLVIINRYALESYYYYSEKNSFLDIYEYINSNIDEQNVDMDFEIKKMALRYGVDITIKKDDEVKYTNKEDFSGNFGDMPDIKYDVKYSFFNQDEIMFSNQKIYIRKIQDKKVGVNCIVLSGRLDNDDSIYIRMPITLIDECVKLSSKTMYVIAFLAILLGGITVLFISERFSKPIEDLHDIANRIANLNFSKKYKVVENNDELDELGKSINTMSNKLEETIKQLKQNNSELERDIEEKSKIDEMRKQFISDVSHELKTPIALIQGYAEGLIENVNSDEENRKFYAEVILDESNKMDNLVKKLLELMKLEYGERDFHDERFDITELILDIIKNSKVVLDEKEIKVETNIDNPVYVYADNFYIEQVFRNYFTNAIKNIKEINSKKLIKIGIVIKNNVARISVFNTGDKIDEENLNRIWNRFYKVDQSRNRNSGGTGIGLSIVKAIMNQYGNDYGVVNKKDGVEFYFDVKLDESQKI